MKVKLISTTQNLLDVLFTGARTCYSAGSPIDMFKDVNNIPPDKKLKLINGCIKSGHLSVLEHSQFTFAIEGVSRALTHQLVRHRHASYSQQSQRYVTFKGGQFDYITPKSVKKDEKAKVLFNDAMSYLASIYDSLLTIGIPAEDARAVLPNACCTNINVSMNLRELIHLCNERLCTRAQLEIRQLVQLMVKEVLRENEWLKPYLQPKCESLGYCPEHKGCGRKPSYNQLVDKE